MTEDEVFEGVRRLILANEYRDTRWIQIGPLPEPPRRLADGTIDQISARNYFDHLPVSKTVRRGSAEYAAARDGGLLTPLPPLPTATPEAIFEAENVIGYPLPRLLRRLYLEAGNGGFGPGRGILGVRGGVPDNDWEDLVQLHLASQADPESLWSPWLIGIYDWGCAVWSLIDCRDPAGCMVSWVGDDQTLRYHDQVLSEWLALWLECRLETPEGTVP